MYYQLDKDQMKRIKHALKVKKFGALETWRELFTYQRACKDPRQLLEIADWARRYNKGEKITLPLMNYDPKKSLLNKEKTGDILEKAKGIFV